MFIVTHQKHIQKYNNASLWSDAVTPYTSELFPLTNYSCEGNTGFTYMQCLNYKEALADAAWISNIGNGWITLDRSEWSSTTGLTQPVQRTPFNREELSKNLSLFFYTTTWVLAWGQDRTPLRIVWDFSPVKEMLGRNTQKVVKKLESVPLSEYMACLLWSYLTCLGF